MDADDSLIGNTTACDDLGIAHPLGVPVTAPTPERRVGEEWVKEIAALPLMDGSVGLPRLGLPKSSAAFPHFCRVHNGQVALALDLLDERAANAALTAEVERLRGVANKAVGWLDSPYHSGRVEAKARLRAALSLPTPAPEATE